MRVRPVKRKREARWEAASAEPLLNSPPVLGPVSFIEAYADKPHQPAERAQQSFSLVETLHVGGNRIGYVPLHCPAVQQPRRADAACSRPHNPRGHPFVINGFRSAPPPYDECVTPEHSEPDEPHKVLVYATSETE